MFNFKKLSIIKLFNFQINFVFIIKCVCASLYALTFAALDNRPIAPDFEPIINYNPS